MGCLGLRLLDEAGQAQVPLRPDQWDRASLWLLGLQEPHLTASPEDPEPQASHDGE